MRLYFYIILFFLLIVSVNNVVAQSISNYSVSRSTGNTYTSIIPTGTAFSAWRRTGTYNYDDNRSQFQDIGFDFWYNGTRYTQLCVSTNGFIDFSSSTADGFNGSSYSYNNTQFTGTAGTLLALAPIYDDMTTQGSSDPMGNSIKYLLSGTEPNRYLTVEWKNMAVYGNTTPNLNFQVRLYENTGVIEFQYDTMDAGTNTFSYTCGINAATMSTTPTAAQLLTQQTANGSTFNNTVRNNLSTLPVIGSKITFTPLTPANPSGTLTFSAITNSSMTLNWTDWASNEVGYAIYKSTDDITYTFDSQAAAGATSRNITGLNPGVTYYWKVYAVTEGAISSALSGNQATSPPGTKISTGTGSWNTAGTWSPSGVPTSTDNILIKNGHTVTINANANCYNITVGEGASGILKIGNSTTVRTFNVYGNITIQNGGTFTANTASSATHLLNLYGDSITNNGTFNLSSDGNSFCNITFLNDGNQYVTGSGTTTNFRNITLNMGSSNSNILEILSSDFQTTSTSFLTLTNGTFKLSSPATISEVPFSAAYTINSTCGLWLNSSNATLSTGANVTLYGDLTISAGLLQIGNASDENLISGGGQITISGGNLEIAGRLDRVDINSITKLNISDGTLIVPTYGSTSTTIAPIEMSVLGSFFEMSGGTIILRREGGTGANDLGIVASDGTLDVTGGTLQIGDGSTPASQTISINSSVSFANLNINSANATAKLTNDLTVFNDFTISSGAFDGNTYNLSIGRHWTNSGTFTPGTCTVTFNGSGTQNITNASGETFYNLTNDKSSGTTVFVNDISVTNILNMTAGNFNCGSNTLTLGTGTGSTGTLSYTSGNIIGKFKRWINSTGSPIIFPLGTSSYSRQASLTFTNLTAGTLLAEFTSSDPGTSGLPLSDGGFSIDAQFTDGYWGFTAANGLASTNYDIDLTGDGFSSYTVKSSTRLLKRTDAGSAWTFSGSHASAVSNTAKRTGVSTLSAQFGFGKTACSPFSATTITGNTAVCTNDAGVTYSVSSTTGNTYTWSVTGGSITAGQGTSSITVTWGATGGDGEVSVTEQNDCADNNTPIVQAIIIHAYPTSSISGSAIVAQNETGVAYSVNEVSGYSYTWSVTGGSVASGNGTSAITVDWGSGSSGTVYVTVTRTCGADDTKNLPVTINGPIVSTGSGNWTSSATWGGIVPGSSDYVEIASGHTVVMNGNSGSCYKLTINGTANWINDGYTTNVGNGGIEITSTGNITGSVAGTLTTTGGLIINSTLSANTVSIVTQTTADQTLSGTGSLAKLTINTNTTNNGNITVRSLLNGSATFTQGNNSTLAVEMSSISLANITATASGNTISYNSSSAQSVKNIPYYNLSFSGSGTKSLTANTTVTGILSLTNSTLDVTSNNYTLTIGGNWTGTSATFNQRFGNVIFNGTSTLDWANNALSLNNVTISNSLSGISSANFYVHENWINNGTFNHNNGTVTFDGTTAISGSGTNYFNNLTITGALTAPSGNINVAGNLINNGTFTNNNGTVTFNGTSTLSGSSAFTFKNVIISGDLSGVSSGNFNINGNFTNNGTYNHNNGTVTFTGTTASLSGTSGLTAFNNLIINNGTLFDVDPSHNITTAGTLTVNGTFTLNSDASSTSTLIDNGIAGTGSLISERYLAGNTPWYTAVPLSNGQGSLYGLDANNKMFYWNEVSGAWISVSNPDNLTVMVGYPFKSNVDKTISFNGNFNTGDKTIDLTRTSTATRPGWNLVGNPYPSAIDWDASGWTKLNIYSNTFWIRSGDQFLTYNGNTHIGVPEGTTSKIPAHQGFWVMIDEAYTSGTLSVPNSSRVHDSQNILKATTASLELIRVNLTKDGLMDQAAICFDVSASSAKDPFDSEKSFGVNIPQIYTLSSVNKSLAINTFPEVISNTEIRLGYKAVVAGNHVISITDFSNINNNLNVYLEDTQLGIVQNMRAINNYSFNTAITTNATRFKLIFDPNPLPVSLLYFTAKCVNGKVDLNWATASEIENDYFAIEKSNDGTSFTEIDRIYGKGTSDKTNSYNYIDFSLEDINYYRLKQVDTDGKFNYSSIVFISCVEAKKPIVFYENRIINIINLDESSDFSISLIDLQGKTIYNVSKKPQNEEISIKIPELPAGVYLLKIISSENSISEKIVIK